MANKHLNEVSVVELDSILNCISITNDLSNRNENDYIDDYTAYIFIWDVRFCVDVSDNSNSELLDARHRIMRDLNKHNIDF